MFYAKSIDQELCKILVTFLQLRAKFTVDDYSHYLFTPRDLTHWVLSFLRYDLASGAKDNSADTVFEIFAYEARRLFRDRIVGQDGQLKFDNMLQSVILSDWSTNIFDNLDSM